MSLKTSNALAVALLLVALTLRLWQLGTLPPGLQPNEIDDIRITETARQGRIEVFYDLNGQGREGLYGVIESVVTSAIGSGEIGYRMLSVWAGLMTLALIYALAKRLYSPVAALSALALLAVGMWPILLSRFVGRETLLPALVTGVLVSLSHALSIPHWRKSRTPITTPFTALALLLGIGFYIHPFNHVIVLMTMLVIAYLVIRRYSMSRRRLGYTAFAIVVLVVLTVPYLISSIRLPELAGASRVFDNFAVARPGPLQALLNGLGGFIFVGDANPLHNLPERPMIDLVSGLFAILGLLVALRHVQQPRFSLLLIATLVLAPLTLMQTDSPNFLSMSPVLPLLALFFGIGVGALWYSLSRRSRLWMGLALVGLLLFNLQWTVRDLFIFWQQLPTVQEAYNARIAHIARYLDETAGDIPTVVCVSNLEPNNTEGLDTFELLAVMMHRQIAPLRFADCGTGLVLANGGERQQVVFPEVERLFNLRPEIQNWLDDSEPVEDARLPEQTVIVLDVAERLANTVGRFTTTQPLSFAPEAPGGAAAVFPPVRFGGNITFLGYEGLDQDTYQPGDWLTLVTYWRVDGIVPPDLRLFTHILYDPTVIAAQHDTISVMPALLLPRDVFLQVTFVQLPPTIPAGVYRVSIGAYEDNTDVRLDVFDGEQPRGTRLFIAEIVVE